MLEEIKTLLEKVTRGDDWTNMTDAGEETKYVAEYNRLTENMGGLIATCESVDAAQFIANEPEWLRYLIGEVEQWEKTSVNLHKKLEQQSTFILELQKALEGLVNLMDLTGYLKLNQEYRDAVNILQSIQGGDNT